MRNLANASRTLSFVLPILSALVLLGTIITIPFNVSGDWHVQQLVAIAWALTAGYLAMVGSWIGAFRYWRIMLHAGRLGRDTMATRARNATLMLGLCGLMGWGEMVVVLRVLYKL